MGVASRNPEIRATRQFSGTTNPISRTGLYEGPRPLLCVRAAHISVRLAPRPLGRPAPKSERYMAQLLRCGLELMDCAERSVRHLKVLQKRRCLATGERLLKNAEVDHHVPLFKVWHDYRDRPWPALLAFWGVPNLQVINRSAHVEKCAQEAGERRPHEVDPGRRAIGI